MDRELSRAPEFEGFFAGLSRHELCFPRCRDCGRFHWYPLKHCPHCQGSDIGWQAVAGPAQLYSWTVVRYAFDPDFAGRLPYIVALVAFDEAPGVRLVSNLIEVETEDLEIGQALEPVFPGDERVLFRPRSREA